MLSPQPTNVGRGNDVLGQIFGSPDVSRTVAQNAAATSGIDPAAAQENAADARHARGRLHVQAEHGASGCTGRRQWRRTDGGLGGLLGGLLGQGGRSKAPGLAGMLDLDGDGNPLDDIMGLASKFLR